MSKHTPEPWTSGFGSGITGPTARACEGVTCGEQVEQTVWRQSGSKGDPPESKSWPIVVPFKDGFPSSKPIVYVVWGGEVTKEEALANAARIVECINGCEGINPDAVKDLLGAATKAEQLLDAILSLYGQGLEVANWHMNGDTEPFDNFIDDNSDGTELAELKAAIEKARTP